MRVSVVGNGKTVHMKLGPTVYLTNLAELLKTKTEGKMATLRCHHL
jgi:hypothetical protein